MGQDGIPISLAIVISAALLSVALIVGMLFLAILPALAG